MIIVMETAPIHPPVGLNIFVIENIVPDIALKRVFPGIATGGHRFLNRGDGR